ncbi:MAG: DUF3053 family protein [Azoarcus sp.]|nr:DUF3053 family protein [Azoarcus sp.]
MSEDASGGFSLSSRILARNRLYSDMVGRFLPRPNRTEGFSLMNKRFSSIAVLWMLCFAMLLVGCSREQQQQRDFINFLKKEVIPRNSGILVLTKAMRKKFGIYTSHYDVIVAYNKAVLEKVSKPLEKAQREYQEAVKPEASVGERKKAILIFQETLTKIEATLGSELAKADSELAALVQPDILKDVYNQAVEKHIRIPAEAFKSMIPEIREMMGKNIALLDYISASKGKVEIKDGLIQVDRNKDKDQAALNHINEMKAEILRITQAIQAQHGEFTRQLIAK